jgi:hypothetical protein
MFLKPSNLKTLLRSKPFFPQKGLRRVFKKSQKYQTFICYNAIMAETNCKDKTKCYFCDADSKYTSDYDGYIVDTCDKHFKYRYMG